MKNQFWSRMRGLLIVAALIPLPVMATVTSAPAPPSMLLAPSAQVQTADETAIQSGIEILENLRVFDLMISVARQKILSSPDVASEDRPVLSGYLTEELQAQRGVWLRQVSIGCIGNMTGEQIKIMLKLSKIKFVQRALAAGTDPSLPQPDFAKESPEDQNLINSNAANDAISAFMTNFKPELLVQGLRPALMRAAQRFADYKAAQKKS